MVLQYIIDQKHNICESGSEKEVLNRDLRTAVTGNFFTKTVLVGRLIKNEKRTTSFECKKRKLQRAENGFENNSYL
jgi:hypothetical protein